MANYKRWSEVKSEIYKPAYKVLFEPGKRVIYCGKYDLKYIYHDFEAIANGKNDNEVVNYEPAYKVSFPGERNVSSGSRYNLRQFKDPRLGVAKRIKETVFDELNIDDSVADDDKEWNMMESEKSNSDNQDKDDSDKELDVDKEWNMMESEKSNSDNQDKDDSDEELDVVIIDLLQIKTETIRVDKLPHSPPPRKMNLEKETKRAKRNFRQVHNRSVVNEAQDLKNQDCECAEAAIRFYNDKHDTDYEIVETMGSYCGLYVGFWFHCNFRARRKSDADCKLFFAELRSTEANKLVVKNCKILDGPGHRPDIIRGCEICGDQLLHPVNGFKTGK